MSKYKRKFLTDEELLQCLENDDDSDIALSDEEDSSWDFDDVDSLGAHSDHEVEEEPEDDQDEAVDVVDQIDTVEADNQTENVEGEKDGNENRSRAIQNLQDQEVKVDIQNFHQKYSISQKKDIKWMSNVQYETRNIRWHSSPPEQVTYLPPPIHFFMKYIPEVMFQQMAEKTNLYAVQKNIARFLPTTSEEIKIFIGIHIVMGNL